MKTSTHLHTIYRIKKLDGTYVADTTIGNYEFLSKKNAQNWIKENKLDGVIEREDSMIIVELNGPNYTKTTTVETREII